MKYSLQNRRGYYHVVISYKDDSGKNRQKWQTTRIPVQKGNRRLADKAAEEIYINWLSERKEAKVRKLKLPIADAVKEFNESKRRIVQSTTFVGYVGIGNEVEKYFGNTSIADIDRNKIDRFLSSIRERGVTENTIRHYCIYLNSMFKYLAQEGYELSEQELRIKPPSVKKFTGASFLPADEVRMLLSAADESKIRIPIYIAVFLGLRRSEICGLYWDKVDMTSRTIRVCMKAVQFCDLDGNEKIEISDKMKTVFSDRTLPIPDALYDILKEEENKTGPVCRHDDGRPMAPQYLSWAFIQLLNKAGLRKIRFHDLRHTCASLLLSSGASMKEVQVILGHGSYSTTADIYSHVDLSGKTRAIAGLNRIIGSCG